MAMEKDLHKTFLNVKHSDHDPCIIYTHFLLTRNLTHLLSLHMFSNEVSGFPSHQALTPSTGHGQPTDQERCDNIKLKKSVLKGRSFHNDWFQLWVRLSFTKVVLDRALSAFVEASSLKVDVKVAARNRGSGKLSTVFLFSENGMDFFHFSDLR